VGRNATLNLLTEAWIFLVLLVAMPKLVTFLSPTAFGLFSLAWVVVGYLAFLDVGVNRAATKFVSEHLAEQDHESTRQIVRTALVANLILGLGGGLAVIVVAPYLIHSVFKVSADLESQARLVFYAVGLGVPVLLLHGVLRAVLSSFQRFAWINVVNAATTTVQWGVAVVLAWKGHGVALVVFSTVVARMLATAAYGVLLFRLLPDIQIFRARGLQGLPRLLRFGSWVTVSQLISPLLVYLDRVLIAAFLSLAAVTLYTVPYEVMTRLRAIPSSLANTLYPAFSERGVEQLQGLYQGSLRYLLILMLPGILFLVAFGEDLLSLWMGPRFAQQTSGIMQILAVGALANALSYVPYNALQALGRPDITGKFHALELPLHVLLCVALIPRWGISGAALASSVRFSLDAVLLFWAAQRYCACSWRHAWRQLVPILGSSILLGAGMLGARWFFSTAWIRLGCGLIAVAIYFWMSWRLILSEREKPAIARVLHIFRQQAVSLN
jgi:O-antigen/teichoic acid export membrane protein